MKSIHSREPSDATVIPSARPAERDSEGSHSAAKRLRLMLILRRKTAARSGLRMTGAPDGAKTAASGRSTSAMGAPNLGCAHRRSLVGGLVAVLLIAVWGAAAAPSAAPPGVKVSGLKSTRQGPSWIVLQWEGTAAYYDVCYARVLPTRPRALRWETIPGIRTVDYSVVGLTPDSDYQLRVRGYPAAGGAAIESEPLRVRTLPDEPRALAGLVLGSPRTLTTSATAVAGCCLEAYGGRLYLLEAEGGALRLSRIDPASLKLEWTCDVAPPTETPALPCLNPDMCVSQNKLWITWTVAIGPGAHQLRQRLVFYDLSGEPATTRPDTAGRLSALLEVQPRTADRGTCGGTVASFLDGLWLAWTEVWEAQGRSHATVILAPYEMWRGQLGNLVAWEDCPTTLPANPAIARFEGSLVVMLTDQEPIAEGREPLLAARFDGKRFRDVHTVRRLGRSRNPRGVQLYDHFYFVYQSDAAYPAGGGLYYDIALGRLGLQQGGGATGAEPGQQAPVGIAYVSDMKCNYSPDVAVLGDALYVVCAKQDDAAGLAPVGTTPAPHRGWGCVLGTVTPALDTTAEPAGD